MGQQALFYLLLTNVLGGTSYFAAAYALRGFSPIGLVFFRTLLGSVLFLPFLVLGPRRLTLPWRDWLGMAAVGILGCAAPLVLGNMGQKLSSATNASLLVGIEPVSVLVLSAVFLGETLTGLKVLAISCGLLGSAVIILQGIPFLNASITPRFHGDLLLFLHGFLWALYTVIGKPVLKRVDAMSFAAITTFFCLLAMSVAAVCSSEPLTHALTPGAIGGIVYLGAAITILGVIAWNKALKLLPASQLANFIFLQPLVGVILGVFVQKESFTFWSALGGGLILMGVYAACQEFEESEEPAAELAEVL